MSSDKIVQKYRSREIAVGQYKMVMTVNEKKVRSLKKHNELARDCEGHEFLAKVKLLPNDPQSSIVVVVQLRQLQMPTGLLSLNPFISIGRILPPNSLIFQLVEKGDVEGLKHLINSGEVTLRDRDIYGTPLLHVSRL
jgi:hypothetical protein